MGKYYNPSQQTKLGVSYNITKSHPFDLRTIVGSFSDLINPNTFGAAAYDRMKVLVADEMNVYMLKATGDNEPGNASWDFDEEDYNNNKKLWKRLTIETINANNDNDAAGALTRAKENLVNGALIYIANDIKSGEELIQKSGLYFCQNVNGEGVLTMAGGGELEDGEVTTAKIGKNAVTTDKIDDNAVTGAKIATGAVNAGKLDTDFLNSLATKVQYDALTEGMVVEGEETPTIMGAINKAITESITGILNTAY